MQTKLFTKLEAGSLTFKNRLHVPPMCTWQTASRDGVANQNHINHYVSLVRGGFGAVTIEATGVVPEGRISPFCLGLWDDKCEAGFKALVDAMKQADNTCKVLVQLNHAGRKASCDPRVDRYVGPAEGGWNIVAPSAIASPGRGFPVPHALSADEIKGAVQAFAEASKRAVAAGVDGIMLHAAHGFLIHQFLSPLSNTRTDEYGGSQENRLRFLKEVLEAVRSCIGTSCELGIRISYTDWAEGGLTDEDITAVIKLCEAYDLSFVDVSTGGLISVPIPLAPGYQLPFAAKVKAQTKMAVFGVGLIQNSYQAETALQLGACDVIDIGRKALSDPLFPYRAVRELREQNLEVPFLQSFAMNF